jgi:hypothetical protein
MRGALTTRHLYDFWHVASYSLVHHDELVALGGDASPLGAQTTLLDYDWLPHSGLEPAALPFAGEPAQIC